VDHDRFAIVIENDDLEKPAGSVGADVEVAVALAEHADGVSYGVFHVQISDAVLACGVINLHVCRLPCMAVNCGPIGS